jgi:hypothetical protein
VYRGPPGHPYNSIRPMHEPGPIGTGSYASADGIPLVKGEVLRRVAMHDNPNLHVAAIGFWVDLRPRRLRRALRAAARRHRRVQPAAALRPHAEP